MGVCERCGTFVCDECCGSHEPLLCRPCFERDAGEWVTVRAFNSPVEADLARSVLSGSEVPSRLVDEATMGIVPHMNIALGGVKLAVRPADLARAEQLLDMAATEGGSTALADEALEREAMEAGSSRPADAVEKEEPEEAPLGRCEAAAKRAFNVAVVGLILLPVVLHLYSLLILWGISPRRGEAPLSRQGRRRAIGALVIDVLVLGTVAALVSAHG